MSIPGIYRAAAGVSAAKAATVGFGVTGACLGAVYTSYVVTPLAVFALIMAIDGKEGRLVKGAVPTVLTCSIGTICLGGVIGGVIGAILPSLPSLALAATEVALRALN